MSDLWTVCWKEWQEAMSGIGEGIGAPLRLTRTYLGRMVVLVVATTVLLSLQGSRLLTHAGYLLLPIVLPLLSTSSWVMDALVGERERQTLATLLASRLPDGAIFWGKVLVPMLVVPAAMGVADLGAWGVGALRSGSLAPPFYIWTLPGLSLAASSLGAGISSLMAGRSPSLRAA